MTTTERVQARPGRAEPTPAHPRPRPRPGQTFVKWVTTTDHKVIGNLYFITSFVWFILGGILAL
ncbi:MAG: cytochrome ubiquinol oxidase subunit I, partial [Terracoccus sp.]